MARPGNRCAHPTTVILALLLLLSSITAGCGENESKSPAGQANEVAFSPEQRIGDPEMNPNSPFLRIAPDGKLHAIWVAADTRPPAADGSAGGNHSSHDSEAGGHGSHNGGTDGNDAIQAAYTAFSTDSGKTWSDPRRVNDQMEDVEGEEGLPKIAVGSDGRVYAAWSIPSGKMYRNDIRLTHAAGNEPFLPAVTLNDTAGVARFPALEISPAGTVFAAWLDRRIDNPAPRAVYLTSMDAAGNVLSSNVKVADSTSCECCRVSMAFAEGGERVHIAYRHKTEDNIRDIAVQTSNDGGVTFGEPVLVSGDGWKIEQCPHSGPTLAVDAGGNLHVVWFTQGEDPKDAGVYYSVSRDGGRSFEPRRLVDGMGGPGVLHSAMAVSEQGDVYIAWDNLKAGEDATEIFFRRVSAAGEMSPVQQLSRADGNAFRPHVAVSGGEAYIAWTEAKGDASWIVMKAAPVR